jgi:hypothetical protein
MCQRTSSLLLHPSCQIPAEASVWIDATGRPSASENRCSTLARLVTLLGLVDDVKPSAAADKAVVTVAVSERLE